MIEVYVDGIRLKPSEYSFDPGMPIGPASLTITPPVDHGARIDIYDYANSWSYIHRGLAAPAWKYGDMGISSNVGSFMYVVPDPTRAWHHIIFSDPRNDTLTTGTIPDQYLVESSRIEEGT